MMDEEGVAEGVKNALPPLLEGVYTSRILTAMLFIKKGWFASFSVPMVL